MPKVYKYGMSVRDRDSRAIIAAQLEGATEYRRQLVEIELERRKAVRKSEHTNYPELGRLRTEAEALEAILALPSDKEDRETAKLARARLKELRKAMKPIEARLNLTKTEAHKVWEAAIGVRCVELGGDGPRTREKAAADLYDTAINDQSLPLVWREGMQAARECSTATKLARANKTCCSGTSMLVEQDVNGAKRTPIGFGKHKSVTRLGVKFAPQVHIKNFFVNGAACQLTKRPEGARQLSSRGKHPLRNIRFRLGAQPEVWIEGSIVYHRPLPEDGVVALIQMVPKRGRANNWEIQFTLETKDEIRKRGNEEPVGLSVCWYEDGDDIIQGVSYDSKKVIREHRIPGVANRERFYDSLLGVIDKLIDEGLPIISELAQESDLTIPRWINGFRKEVPISDLVSTMGHQGARMVPLDVARALTRDYRQNWWKNWKAERKGGARKLDLYAPLGELARWLGKSYEQSKLDWVFLWLKKVDHIWTWYCNGRRNTANYRKQMTHLNAINLYEKHATVVTDDRDLAEVATRAKGQKANATRHKSAAGSLRAKLRQLYASELVESSVTETEPMQVARALLMGHLHGSLADKKVSKLKKFRQKKQKRSAIKEGSDPGARKVATNAAE